MALHFSNDEFTRRKESALKQMKSRNLDALLLFAQESMYWLTGYDTFGFCFFQCLILRKDGHLCLLTRSADERQAKHTSLIEDIRVWTDKANASPASQLCDVLSDNDLLGANLGIEYDTHGLTAAAGRDLDAALKAFARSEDASGLIPKLRAIKSYSECDVIRRAAAIGDDALEAGLEEVKPGANEGRILAAMHASIFEAGGDYPGNEFIIGSGRDALLCRYKSGRRTLSNNDQLTLETAGTWRHYHAALMRTVVIGTITPRHQEMYEAVHAALLAVEAQMRPGNTFGDVFEAHAHELDMRGMQPHRLGACGYSLGARFTPSWMDKPMFYKNNPEPIEPNMCLFAHMILFDSDTETAMCLGRTYLTTENEPEPISRLPLELICKNN